MRCHIQIPKIQLQVQVGAQLTPRHASSSQSAHSRSLLRWPAIPLFLEFTSGNTPLNASSLPSKLSITKLLSISDSVHTNHPFSASFPTEWARRSVVIPMSRRFSAGHGATTANAISMTRKCLSIIKRRSTSNAKDVAED